MRVAVNLLLYTDYQGIEAYTVNLILALSQNFPEDQFILIKHPFSPSFFDIKAHNISEYVVRVSKVRKSLLAITQQWALPQAMYKVGANVLFCTSPTAPFFFKRKITTIHDCAYDRFPESNSIASKWYFKSMFYAAKYFSRGVITVSAFSKHELVDLYGFSPDHVHAVHSALPELPAVTDELRAAMRAKFGVERERYFFYVGNTRPRKNLLGLLKAFAQSSVRNEYRLVLAGKIDTRFLDVAREVEGLGLGDRVVQAGFVTDEEKVALYKDAAALAFPSLYEGFGFPVLEAQSLGVPVITSNTSSLPEVGGEGAALYVDPHDTSAIARAMETVVTDAPLRVSLIAAGRENVKRFSWDKAARETMAVLREATGK